MKTKILIALACLLLAMPAQAKTNNTIVELSDRMKVLQVDEVHIDHKTMHLMKIICFLDKGRNLVFENLSTDDFHVMSSRHFAKRYQYLGVQVKEGVASWSSSK